jgi:hypothetical protein
VKHWHAINTALIKEVLSSSKARDDKNETVLNTTQFHEDQPTSVAYQDVFLECGFEHVGILKEVSEKIGSGNSLVSGLGCV